MLTGFDEYAMFFFQDNVRRSVLNGFMVLMGMLDDHGAIWIIMALVMALFRKTRVSGFRMFLCVAISWVISDLVLKNLVARPRPYETLDGLVTLIAPLPSYSFPSGHACSSFAAATALTMLFPEYGVWAYLPAILIAISRVYVGVHYPTDVIVGSILGTVVAYFVIKMSEKLTNA